MTSKVCILVLAVAAVSLPPAVRAVCPPSGRSPTTAARLACLVTADFASKHLAVNADNAKAKDIRLGRASTFLPESTTTLSALQRAADVTRRAERLATWYCVPGTTATGTPTATCTAPNQSLYFCANPRQQSKQVYHLDDDPRATCN